MLPFSISHIAEMTGGTVSGENRKLRCAEYPSIRVMLAQGNIFFALRESSAMGIFI
jgi:hypothetical protein